MGTKDIDSHVSLYVRSSLLSLVNFLDPAFEVQDPSLNLRWQFLFFLFCFPVADLSLIKVQVFSIY